MPSKQNWSTLTWLLVVGQDLSGFWMRLILGALMLLPCSAGITKPAWDDSVITPAVRAKRTWRAEEFPKLDLAERPRQLKVSLCHICLCRRQVVLS